MSIRKPKNPIHPGEILREEFMAEYGLSAEKLAGELNVPEAVITEIVAERSGLTDDIAARLARYFGNSVEFWLNMQQAYDVGRRGRQMSASAQG